MTDDTCQIQPEVLHGHTHAGVKVTAHNSFQNERTNVTQTPMNACVGDCVCLVHACVFERSGGGLKLLQAVYTNTQTKDTSCSQTGREILLLKYLELFKKKQILAVAEPQTVPTLCR